MMNLIQNKEMLLKMNKYMFTQANMKKFTEPFIRPIGQASVSVTPNVSVKNNIEYPLTVAFPCEQKQVSVKQVSVKQVSVKQVSSKPVSARPVSAKPFTPFQKDKLFWCFFIILNGYEEYEMNRSNSFSLEKQIKIETVEKLKSIKDKLKDLKLKRTELEDELVNKPVISLKGLCALCLVHNVSITYIFGRKYCEIANEAGPSEAGPSEAGPSEPPKKGIIIQNEKKEDSLKWTENELDKTNTDYLTKIREEYWLIENIQKPLKAPSAYTLSDLQVIAEKLQIEPHTIVNEKTKAKTKTKLYEEILQSI
jgi:hypothetical protein